MLNMGASGTKAVDPATVVKVKDIVAQNPLTIFSKTYCPYCTKAKQLFSSLGANAKVLELDLESDGAQMQSALAQWTGQRTVPNIFIGGKHIGGCDDTFATHKQGNLIPLLQDAGLVK